jgi:hypothetical protein
LPENVFKILSLIYVIFISFILVLKCKINSTSVGTMIHMLMSLTMSEYFGEHIKSLHEKASPNQPRYHARSSRVKKLAQ